MAKKTTGWMAALKATNMQVCSARDALQVKGWADTGNYALNWAISGRLLGGYPLGHTGEIFGDPGTGKSYLVARAIAMVQAAGGHALLDDVEHAYNAEHAVKLGIDVDTLATPDPASRTVKEHLGVAKAFVAAFRASPAALGVLACDSHAALSTEHELETGLDKRDMTKAPEMKAFFRIIHAELADLPVMYLATNHTIANIGSLFQSRTTPGGGGSKFMSSFRVDMRAVSKIKKGTDVVGTICRAYVDKNRLVAPFKEVRLAIPFHQPISRASGLVPLLVSCGVLEERGNFLFYQGTKMGRAYKTKERFLEQDETGEQVLMNCPDVLEEADAALAAQTAGPLRAEESDEVDDGEEESTE